VRASFISSYRTYGARRVWHALLAEGLSCGLHRIERLMRVHGMKARPRRRGLPKDDGLRPVIADNILGRHSSPSRRIRSGSPTSHTSGPAKDRCTSLSSSTFSPDVWSAGR
jgi:transposase InsO family protein